MAEAVYTTVPGKIKPLLAKIRSTGVPKAMTVAVLKQMGFTSSNDTSLLGVLRMIDFVDASKVPTPRWSAYRGGQHRAVLGEAVQHGYSALYDMYPDAHARPVSDLDHFFSTTTQSGKQVISKTISTFKALADEADFTHTHAEHAQAEVAAQPKTRGAQLPAAATTGGSTSLHIDLQIHISPEASAKQIETIFASIGKHIYGRN
jgi:hypothetical protein